MENEKEINYLYFEKLEKFLRIPKNNYSSEKIII